MSTNNRLLSFLVVGIAFAFLVGKLSSASADPIGDAAYTFSPQSGPAGEAFEVEFTFTPDTNTQRFYFVGHVPMQTSIWMAGVIDNLPSECGYENGHTGTLGSSIGDYFGASCPGPYLLAGVTYTAG